MNEELVRLNTEDVGKAIPITNSLIISERIDYPHYQITRLIKRHLEDFKEFGAIDFEKQLLNSKQVEVIHLNESQFLLLVTYLRVTNKKEKVKELKKQIVKQFMFMKNELQARQETRQIGKQIRKSLTDTIKSKVSEEGNFKKFAYSNYSKLVFKTVLGMNVKKYKELNGLKEKDNIRNFLNLEQLEKVQALESKIAFYIEMRTDITMNDKEVYTEVKKYVDSLKTK